MVKYARHNQRIEAIQRRRSKWRKIVNGNTLYDCPKCGRTTLRIKTVRKTDGREEIKALCSDCGLDWTRPKVGILEVIDYYNKLCDNIRSKRS